MDSNIRHWVYAIGAMQSTYTVAAIKIGVTSGAPGRPVARMFELQTGNHLPLRILAFKSFPGRKDALRLESAAHHNFGYARLSGEWFTPTEAVCAWVRESMLNTFPIDDLDEHCMRYWDEPGSGHQPDEDGDCPCGYEARDWSPAE